MYIVQLLNWNTHLQQNQWLTLTTFREEEDAETFACNYVLSNVGTRVMITKDGREVSTYI